MSDLVPVNQPGPEADATAQPDSIEELFSRDPNGWSNSDLDKIVETLRAKRKSFNEAELKKLTEEKPKKPKAIASTGTPKAKPDTGNLDLSDLGLL